MILQRLYEYYNRLFEEGVKVAPFGFQQKELPFIIVLDQDGTFVNLEDTRTKEGKKLVAKRSLIPAEKSRPGKNAHNIANILWDKPGYLFGEAYQEGDVYRKQQESFIGEIEKIFGSEPEDEGVRAVLTFLKRGDFSEIQAREEWKEIQKKGPFIGFRLRGDDPLVCQREKVMEKILSEQENEEGAKQFCLVSGRKDHAARLHPKIKGIWGAQSSGATLVSFNLSAFDSYGKSQGANAPVGEKAAFAYTTVLNRLLRSDDHRLRLGDVTVVFWSQKPNILEDHFTDLFATDTSRMTESEDIDAIRKVLTSPKSGMIPEEDLELPFYVLGLSPNAARISVRFWYEGSVGKTLENIRRYFDELRIVKQFDNESDFPTLGKLLPSTALEYKWDNVPPNLTGAFFLAALNGTRYPETLLSSVIRRIRAEAGKKDSKTKKQVENIPRERAALLKALLIRNHKKEITMSLDTTRNDPAYLLGRLFAVLEHLQIKSHEYEDKDNKKEQNKQKKKTLNSTIRDRYYGSASSTPIAVFPTLLKLSTHHLSKLDNPGLKNWYESLIQEILKPLEEWPTHLPLAEQAMFALGYYHQRADLYTSKNDKITEGENNE